MGQHVGSQKVQRIEDTQPRPRSGRKVPCSADEPKEPEFKEENCPNEEPAPETFRGASDGGLCFCFFKLHENRKLMLGVEEGLCGIVQVQEPEDLALDLLGWSGEVNLDLLHVSSSSDLWKCSSSGMRHTNPRG